MRARALFHVCLWAAGPCVLASAQTTFSPTGAGAPPAGMVLVPAGAFIMGTHKGVGDETPQHTVKLPACYMDACEVTNAEYQAFVKATGHRAPAPVEGEDQLGDWKAGAVVPGRERLPVGYVDWSDAAAYAAWAGKRLPTEEEWEKAARGSDGREYPWRGPWDATKCNFVTDGPTEVGSFPQGVSPCGCLDMAGNVWEWTASYYERYPGNKQQGNADYGHKYRVLRGGSWADHCMYGVRCYARSYGDPANRLPGVGLRCALSAPDVKAFAGVVLPAGIPLPLGRQLLEALARAVPKWRGRAQDVALCGDEQHGFQVALPSADGASSPATLDLRPLPTGVWVALARPGQ